VPSQRHPLDAGYWIQELVAFSQFLNKIVSPKQQIVGERMLTCHLIRRSVLALGIAASAALTGCASIVSGTTQVVSVDTTMAGQPVEGAKCTLTNSKGTFYVTTPGTVPVHRAYGNLAITCTKDPLPTGTATVKSSTKGMAAGNLLFGGAIGIAVDASSGAAYDYPEALHVLMGQSIALGGAAPAPTGTDAGGSPAPLPQTTGTPSGQPPHTLAEVAVAVNTPVSAARPPELPPVPPEMWDARLSCGERLNFNDGKLYNARFTMEVRGKSVKLHREGNWGAELMSGDIYNGELALTGHGFRIDNSKRPWDFSLRGAMPPGSTTYLAKGALLSGGKIARECQLTAIRVPEVKAATAALPPAAPAM
jgi:hypothetical protein